MARRVAIVATAQTKYAASKPWLIHTELIWEVVEKVLQQTGLKYEDHVPDEARNTELFIDKVICVMEDFWQGRGITCTYAQQELGNLRLDGTKVSADGAQAVYFGVISILSGQHDIALVVADRKESEAAAVKSVIENAALDPIYLGPLGLDFLSAAALQARRYTHQYGITPEQRARVVVKNRKNAANNPYAQEPLKLTVEDVLASPMLASPLRSLECKPLSDGACAMILASEEKARKLTNKPVWITGIGNCYDAHYFGDRELARCDSLVQAAKRSYQMAGITNPRKEIDVAEISEEYSYQELLWTEGLGFCPAGEGGRLIDEGVTEMGGELPVNPSGGVLSGNPSGVAGLARVAEAALQLRGEAEGRQVANAKTALAHGVTGPCGQAHCVITLSR